MEKNNNSLTLITIGSIVLFFLVLIGITGTGFIVPNEEILILFCFIAFVRLAYLNTSSFIVSEFDNYSDAIYFANESAFSKVKGSLSVIIECFDLLDSLLAEITVLASNIQLYVEFVLERKTLIDLFFRVEDNLLLILRQSSELSRNHNQMLLNNLAKTIL
jgi:hypothetical protein